MEQQFAEKYRKYAFATILVLTIVFAAIIMIPFFPALMWAGVLAVLVYPVYEKLKTKMSSAAAAGLSTLTTLLMVGVPLALIAILMSLQISTYAADFADSRPKPEGGWTFQTALVEADLQIKPFAERLGAKDFSLSDFYEKNKEELNKDVVKWVTSGAKVGVQSALTLVIAFLTLFFALRDGHKLRDPVLELLPVPKEKGAAILERMRQTIHSVFVGVVLVAFFQGLLAGIGYWVAGVPSPAVWMVATMVLCVVPLIGSPFVYVPLGLILIASGKPTHGIGLLLWGFLIVSNVDNVLRPWIIGSRVELHYMAIFFSLLGGVLAMGPVGLMAGPILLTILLALQDILRERLNATGTPEASPSAENAGGEASLPA